jgi:activator of HSP90 ATPase
MKYHYTKIRGKWMMVGIDEEGKIHMRIMNHLETFWYYLNPFMK